MLRTSYSAFLARAEAPDFNQLTDVSAVAVIVSLLAGLVTLIGSRSRELAEAAAFYGLLIGGGAALVVYLIVALRGVP